MTIVGRLPPSPLGISTFGMLKQDIRNQPAYTLAEAARYLKVAPATLRSWVVGRSYEKTKGIK